MVIFYLGLLLYLLHPILVSLIVYAILGSLLWSINSFFRYGRFEQLWRRTLGVVGLILLACVVADSVFAFPRVYFGYRLPDKPVALATIPTPSTVILVNVLCQEKCLERLVAGAHSEIIYATTVKFENGRSDLEPPYPAVRFRITRAAPGDCPSDNQRQLERQWLTEPVVALQSRGICPVIEPAELPESGIFIVNEAMRRGIKEPAVEMKLKFIATKLPGPVSYYNATEVQQRSSAGVKVLGRIEDYVAPGFLGVPPMVGCFSRPDNLAWIVPPGEPGCGLWRMTTASGNTGGRYHGSEWVYEQVFQAR